MNRRAKQLLDSYGFGISVDTIEVQTSAPIDVRNAFDEVLNAQQTAATKISEANTYASSTTNAALGQASVILSSAITHSNEVVRTVAAEAMSFTKQLPIFTINPDLFKNRQLTETMQTVLANAQEKFFIPARADGNKRELRLQLNRIPQKLGITNSVSP